MNWRVPPEETSAEGGEIVSTVETGGSTLAFPDVPAPPLHEICCVIAISASHRAMDRILERGERLRTSRHKE